MGLSQPLIPWLPDVTSLGIKRPGRVFHHSRQSSVRAKNASSYVSAPTVDLYGSHWDSLRTKQMLTGLMRGSGMSSTETCDLELPCTRFDAMLYFFEQASWSVLLTKYYLGDQNKEN